MGFLATLDSEEVTNIWKNFDKFLIKEFKAANEGSMSEEDINNAIKDGNLTIKYQAELKLESLSGEDLKSKVAESEEYLVLNFAEEETVNAFKAWKEAN